MGGRRGGLNEPHEPPLDPPLVSINSLPTSVVC